LNITCYIVIIEKNKRFVPVYIFCLVAFFLSSQVRWFFFVVVHALILLASFAFWLFYCLFYHPKSYTIYACWLLLLHPPTPPPPSTHTHTLVCNNIFLATKQVIDVSPLLFILSKNEYFSSHAKRENVIARDQAIFFLPFSKGFFSSLLSHTFKV